IQETLPADHSPTRGLFAREPGRDGSHGGPPFTLVVSSCHRWPASEKVTPRRTGAPTAGFIRLRPACPMAPSKVALAQGTIFHGHSDLIGSTLGRSLREVSDRDSRTVARMQQGAASFRARAGGHARSRTRHMGGGTSPSEP